MVNSHEDELLPKFGGRLRSLRSFFGSDEKVFAAAIGIGTDGLSGLERGRTQPSFDVLLRISYLTTCSLDFLVTGRRSHEVERRQAGEQSPCHENPVFEMGWYWRSDENHKIVVSCKPEKFRSMRSGVIGSTRWDYVGIDPNSNVYWRKYLKTLEARRPFCGVVIRGRQRFVALSGRPFYGMKGEFGGYHGFTAPLKTEQAIANWQLSFPR